jgi:hypothetical protein
MKKWYLALISVMLLCLVSWHLRIVRKNVLTRFPNELAERIDKHYRGISLFLFFSNNSCVPCLDAIEVLNSLKYDVDIWGVLPNSEYPMEAEIKRRVGALFPFTTLKKDHYFIPFFSPTLVGTVRNEILFVLPLIPDCQPFLRVYLSAMKIKGVYLL